MKRSGGGCGRCGSRDFSASTKARPRSTKWFARPSRKSEPREVDRGADAPRPGASSGQSGIPRRSKRWKRAASRQSRSSQKILRDTTMPTSSTKQSTRRARSRKGSSRPRTAAMPRRSSRPRGTSRRSSRSRSSRARQKKARQEPGEGQEEGRRFSISIGKVS